MSKRNWVGALALGLVCGWVLFPITGLIFGYTNPPSYNYSSQISESEQGGYTSQDEPHDLHLSFWKWSGHWIESGDTFAQWIMMVFTVIAAGLLLWTLFVTLKMARDTREIGEAQVRGYIELSDFHGWLSGQVYVCTNLKISNTGNSPLRQVHIIYRAYAPDDVNETISEDGMIFSEAVFVGDIGPNGEVYVNKGPPLFRNGNPKQPHYGAVVGVFAVDVFGKGVSEFRLFSLYASEEHLRKAQQLHRVSSGVTHGFSLDLIDLLDRGWPKSNFPHGKPEIK